jgi:hypothetical protein
VRAALGRNVPPPPSRFWLDTAPWGRGEARASGGLRHRRSTLLRNLLGGAALACRA